MRKFLFLIVMLGIFGFGCAPRNPVTNVQAVDSRPTLSFVNAPKGAVVLVDGINMGEAALYNGSPKVLTVQSGTHDVVISMNGSSIFEQTVFVESEHKTITIK